uniref:Uncharacterized protein n=1 Tax=Rhizophagus irregularis (strain DAOM 181602 / DAOM 197198 / MUCL 43194) TaxID=747089 RepID=U9TJA9_RHIID
MYIKDSSWISISAWNSEMMNLDLKIEMFLNYLDEPELNVTRLFKRTRTWNWNISDASLQNKKGMKKEG